MDPHDPQDRTSDERAAAARPRPADAGTVAPEPGAIAAGVDETGARAARNTVIRAVAEIAGKLASLVLFGALARAVGEAQLGVFVFAFSFVQIAIVPIDLGFDRYFTREVARDRRTIDELFSTILVGKLLIALPVFATAFVVVGLLRPDDLARDTVYLLSVGLLLDSLSRTATALFMGLERGGLVAYSITTQRVSAAALGLAVLAAGYGVTAVAVTYACGSALGLGVTLAMLRRLIGRIPLRRRWPWRSVGLRSVPFAIQDGAAVLLYKLDDVMLSVLATDAAVGRYGAAYRLLEATFFLTFSLVGAFSAMYVYLGEETVPTIGAAFQRSIKAALALLVPLGVIFATLAEPLVRLVFGAGLAAAAEPLRLLGPVVVLLGVFTLSATLVMSRSATRPIVIVGVLMVVVNVGLNLVLIPLFEDLGAAMSILATTAVSTVVALGMAARVVGGVEWAATLAGPLLAGAVMAAPALLLGDLPLAATAAAAAAYLVTLVAIERRISPGDVRFVRDLVRRGLSPRTVG